MNLSISGVGLSLILLGVAAVIAASKFGRAAQTTASARRIRAETDAYCARMEFEPDPPASPTIH